jgi:hypothetical protein
VSPACALCATWWLLALLLGCLLDITWPGGAQGPFLPTWASWARCITSNVSHIEYASHVCLQLVLCVPHGGCGPCCWDACLTSLGLVGHKAPAPNLGQLGKTFHFCCVTYLVCKPCVCPACALCATWWLLALLLGCLLDITWPGEAQGPLFPTWASWAIRLSSSVSYIE